jgi:hypothetical protein
MVSARRRTPGRGMPSRRSLSGTARGHLRSPRRSLRSTTDPAGPRIARRAPRDTGPQSWRASRPLLSPSFCPVRSCPLLVRSVLSRSVRFCVAVGADRARRPDETRVVQHDHRPHAGVPRISAPYGPAPRSPASVKPIDKELTTWPGLKDRPLEYPPSRCPSGRTSRRTRSGGPTSASVSRWPGTKWMPRRSPRPVAGCWRNLRTCTRPGPRALVRPSTCPQHGLITSDVDEPGLPRIRPTPPRQAIGGARRRAAGAAARAGSRPSPARGLSTTRQVLRPGQNPLLASTSGCPVEIGEPIYSLSIGSTYA